MRRRAGNEECACCETAGWMKSFSTKSLRAPFARVRWFNHERREAGTTRGRWDRSHYPWISRAPRDSETQKSLTPWYKSFNANSNSRSLQDSRSWKRSWKNLGTKNWNKILLKLCWHFRLFGTFEKNYRHICSTRSSSVIAFLLMENLIKR